MDKKPVLGILLGDATGVGPELVAKTAASGFLSKNCNPVIIGDERVFKKALKISNVSSNYNLIRDINDVDWGKNAIQLLDLGNVDPEQVEYAKPTAYSGKAVNETLIFSVELFKSGKISGIAFAPFSKDAMKQGGCKYESEHHLIAHHLGWTEPFGEVNVLGELWTTRTTSHIPIKDVSENLTVDSIMRAIRLANSTLKNSGIEKPVIGVAALNPHGGENGTCGVEEIEVIGPAVKKANEMGIRAVGPFPSDIVFIKAFKGDFNAVVTMYHDQGQIALKLTGFDQGITIAGGFPMPIVTCAHGTAYDIAGKGIAMTTAFENAVLMTAKIARKSMV